MFVLNRLDNKEKMSAGLLKMKSGVYKCPDDIKNFKISVTLKKLHSSTVHTDSDIDLNITEKEIKTFSWQAKVFSRTEAEFYAKESNCLTDTEKQYHEIITNLDELPGRLFSYVQGDNFNPNEENVTTEIEPNLTKLHKAMSKLRVGKKIKDNTKTKNININYEINKFLNNSITNPFTSNCYETMYVMADLGASEGNSNIWLKSEHIICTIKYDTGGKILWIYPDFSSIPYTLEIDVGGKIAYEYKIENISINKNLEIITQEKEILEKINRRNQENKTQILAKDFLMPSRNILRFYIFCEILSAKNFEYDNIYIQYHVDLAENWTCSDENNLHGTTQTCKTRGDENLAYFGFNFELCLDYKVDENADEIPSYPKIYFEVISHDIWDRYRSEGLSYKFIPIFEPGVHTFTLQCIRIRPKYPTGELRRYFIGDYFNIDDITWVGLPKDHQGNTINKYGIPTIGTGTIDLRLNIINQSKMNKKLSHDPSSEEHQSILDRMSASTLVKSVAEVIMAYRKAKEKMLQARNNIITTENEI